MNIKLNSTSFFLFSGVIIFFLQQATGVRPLRFSNDELITWLLLLGLYFVGITILFIKKRWHVRVLLELFALFFIFQGLWIGLRWGFSFSVSFGMLFLFLAFFLSKSATIRFILYVLGASIFAMVFAFILPPPHLLLLFGGLLIYDTLTFREDMDALNIGRRFRSLQIEKGAGALPLSYHLFPLFFLVQTMYIHPGIGIVLGILFLIGLSEPRTDFRKIAFIYALALLFPYSLSIFLYMYAT